jgi:hypothetical protein
VEALHQGSKPLVKPLLNAESCHVNREENHSSQQCEFDMSWAPGNGLDSHTPSKPQCKKGKKQFERDPEGLQFQVIFTSRTASNAATIGSSIIRKHLILTNCSSSWTCWRWNVLRKCEGRRGVHVGKCIGKIRVPCSPVSGGLYVKGTTAVFCRPAWICAFVQSQEVCSGLP